VGYCGRRIGIILAVPFLSHLHTAIPNINNPLTTMISDRDKGLLKADNEIPLANRALCVEHISRNLQNTYV